MHDSDLIRILCIMIKVNVYGLNIISVHNKVENYTDEEAAKIVGMDRDSSQRIYIMLSKMEIIQNGKCTFKL